MRSTYRILFLALTTLFLGTPHVHAQMRQDPVIEQLKVDLQEAIASGDANRISAIMMQMANRNNENIDRTHAEREARANDREQRLAAEAAEKRRPAQEREEFHTFSKLIDEVMPRVGIDPVQVGFDAAEGVTVEIIHDPIILQLIGDDAAATKVALFEEHFSYVDRDGYRVFRDMKEKDLLAKAKSILARKYTIRVTGLPQMALRSPEATDEIYLFQIQLPVMINTGDLLPRELESARANISWRTLVNQHEIRDNDQVTWEAPYGGGLPVLLYATGFARHADAVYQTVNSINPYFVRPGGLDQLRRSQGRPAPYQPSNDALVDQLKPRFLADNINKALNQLEEDFRAANKEMGLRLKAQEQSIDQALKALNQRLASFYTDALDVITTATASYDHNVDTVAQTLAGRTFVSRKIFDVPVLSEPLFGFQLGTTFAEIRQSHIDVWNALLATNPEYYQRYVLESGDYFKSLPFYEYHSSSMYSDYWAMDIAEDKANNKYWDCEDDNLEITLRRNVTDVALFNHVEALRLHFYGQRLYKITFRLTEDAPASGDQVREILAQRHTPHPQSIEEIWKAHEHVMGMYQALGHDNYLPLSIDDQTVIVRSTSESLNSSGYIAVNYLELEDAYQAYAEACKEAIDAKAADAVGDLF